MQPKFSFKISLIGLGAVAVCGTLYYYFTRKKECQKKEGSKEEVKESPIPLEKLKDIIQYTKYTYYPIFVAVSISVRQAKEESRYTEDFANEMLQRGLF